MQNKKELVRWVKVGLRQEHFKQYPPPVSMLYHCEEFVRIAVQFNEEKAMAWEAKEDPRARQVMLGYFKNVGFDQK